MLRTLLRSFSLYLSPSHTHRTCKKKKTDRGDFVGWVREKVQPQRKIQWQAGWRQRGGHPTPHAGVERLAHPQPESGATHPHYTIDAQSLGREEAVAACRMDPSCFAVSVIYNAVDTWLWGWLKVSHLHPEIRFYGSLVKKNIKHL